MTGLSATIAVPVVTGWQQTILQQAVSLIGYPYVFAGTSETAADRARPGSSGRLRLLRFRLARATGWPVRGRAPLADSLQGRTASAMSGEMPASKRISFASLEPGDVLFFGAAGPRSKPSQIDHTGIYLGGGWMIHSSGQGVALAPIATGYYAARFAWARRPLAEAGLEHGETAGFPRELPGRVRVLPRELRRRKARTTRPLAACGIGSSLRLIGSAAERTRDAPPGRVPPWSRSRSLRWSHSRAGSACCSDGARLGPAADRGGRAAACPTRDWPSVAVLVPARNEAACSRRRFRPARHRTTRAPGGRPRRRPLDATRTRPTCGASRSRAPNCPQAGSARSGRSSRRARAAGEPDYYLLTDADIRHAPGSLPPARRRERGGRAGARTAAWRGFGAGRRRSGC